MSTLTRFDFYRILLPGAVILVVTVFVLRVALLTEPTPHDEAERLLAGALRFLEDPFRGSAIAFSAGFALYLLDPAYSAPEYRRGLPSDHLAKRLGESPLNVDDVRGLYFHIYNNVMTKDLHDRSSLYGAFLRVSVLVNLAAMAGAVLLPVIVALYGTSSHDGRLAHSYEAGWGAVSAVVVAMMFVVLLTVRGVTSRRVSGENLRKGIMTGGVVLTAGLLAWAVGSEPLDTLRPQPEFSRALLVALTALSFGTWAATRLRGPLLPWFRAIVRGQERYVAVDGLSKAEIVLVDTAVTLVAIVGALAVGGVASDGQVVLMLLLPIMSYVMAFTRKAERQQGGIYRNQRDWIDANWDEILKIAPKYAQPSEPSSTA